MLHSAVVVAPAALAVVLLLAALGKLRDSASSTDAFAALKVPQPLRRSWIVASHPWAEIVLAVGLLLASGWLGIAVAVLAVGLTAVYLALVVRAVQQSQAVDCDCFGAWGKGEVTRRTVVRNAWYLLLAAVTLWAQVVDSAPRTVLSTFDASQWWWLLAALGAALTVAITWWATARANGASPAAELDDPEDYVRTLTPAVPVTLADGSVRTLRALSETRAQLLLFVSESCGHCEDVIKSAPKWRSSLPQVDIRLVIRAAPEASTLTSEDEPMSLHDIHGWGGESLGARAFPAAVLLGADGLLAGGPVVGFEGVSGFVAEIMTELSNAPV